MNFDKVFESLTVCLIVKCECEREVEVILKNIFCDAKSKAAPKNINPPLSLVTYLILSDKFKRWDKMQVLG